jgi:hypothetical protein
VQKVNGGPLWGGVRDPGAPTINAEKMSTVAPMRGADGDPGAATINTEKW